METETTAVETEAGTEAFSWVNDEGKLSEGWKERLPEDIRGEKSLDTFDDIPGMAKMLVHGQKMVGRNRIALPTEVSTPEEIDEFYRQIGRPETKDDYKMEVPDELADVMDANVIEGAKELFHKIGLTQAQADALFAFDQKRYSDAMQGNEALVEQATKDAEAALRNKWGAAYDERLHIANKMIADNTDDSNREQVLASIGNNPVVADFLATIGKKFMEGGLVDGVSTSINTPLEAKAKADELRSTPGYLNGQLAKSNPSMHARITEQITEQMKLAYPEG